MYEFYAAGGIVHFFASASAPYQILHDPIHIVGEDGNLHLEAVLAYHSFNDNGLWCFINNGRAVEGGTHTMGLDDALKRLRQRFKLPDRHVFGSQRCRRRHVDSIPADRLGRLHENQGLEIPNFGAWYAIWSSSATKWLEDRPDVTEQLEQLQPFQFSDPW